MLDVCVRCASSCNSECHVEVMVTCGITKDGMSKRKVGQFGVCSMRVKANSNLCLQCGNPR